MDESKVKQIIEETIRLGSETSNVEFKDARGGFPHDTWKTISSFSHHPGGGFIVFGVTEERSKNSMEATGITELAVLQEKMSDVVSSQMSVVIRPEYFPITIGDKTILAIYISECSDQHKPCYHKDAGMPNGAYIRDGNTDRKITHEEMLRFLDNAKLSKFDSTKAPDTQLSDLSEKKIYDLLSRMGQRTSRDARIEEIDFDLLKNLNIADTFDGGNFPTFGGFLIFAKEKPQLRRSFSRYTVRCVKYKGSNVATDIIDKADIDGTLNEQIDTMQKFILRNIRTSAQIVGTKRVDRYEYPEKAIREIIANAIIHRDYRITETYAQVNVFEDRLEVFNPGCLPPGVTIDNIRDAQVSRNETIAARLKDLDYLEEYGRGIDIIFTEMEKWGLIQPIFKNTTNSFKVILPGEKLSKLNERQFRIWDYLVEKKRITVGICDEILSSVPRQTINYDLNKMQELGLIHSGGAGKHTYYEANF
ncbi:MAG: ATP-binding protein [Candidatus Komeilibacteria bacterium]|nr:ATP-binding protein [Candidatus Komeilibacteria bacterium]